MIDNKSQMDFGSPDAVMILMMYGASNLIDAKMSTQQKAEALAGFYAAFLGFRAAHESDHVVQGIKSCPFCMSMELSVRINRQVEK